MDSTQLDDLDKEILNILIENSRTPFTEIAKKLIVSPGTIHVRVKKMEDSGIIVGTSLNIDYNKMGYSFVAYLGIHLIKSSKIQQVTNSLKEIPNVTVANIISGKYSLFCKIRARDTADAKDIIFKIDEIEGVLKTESIISLDETINDKKRLLHAIFK